MNRPYTNDKQPIEKLTWNQSLGMIETLARKIKESGEKFDYIYGIPRGGLIPAVILSHKLRIRFTAKKHKINGSTLIVDDISDTGKTLIDTKYPFEYKGLMTATLHMRHNTKFKPDFCVKEIPDNTWIQYPWEED